MHALRIKIKPITSILLVVSFLFSMSAQSAVFMEYGGVEGGATARGYEGMIPLKTVGTSGVRAVEMTTGEMSNRSRNLPQFEFISAEKEFDKSTIGLITEFMKGKGQPVTIYIAEPGETPLTRLKIVLRDAILAQHEISADGEENTETFQISFTYIEYIYYDEQGNQAGKISYDLATGIAS